MTKKGEAVKQKNRELRGAPFIRRNYAHRGLHDIKNGIPENSLKAFRLAAEGGYGTELDVQLSRDGQVVVFHDDTLNRVCGVDARVDAYDYDDLKNMSLLGTDQRIPLFTEVLAAFDGGEERPLIVELKTGPRNEELCRKTLKLLRGYTGRFCIESFDPRIVEWFRKNAPDIVRGQLATTEDDYPPTQKKALSRLLSQCAFHFLTQPDFIAYKNTTRPKRVLRLRKQGVLLVAWTSREPLTDQKQNDAVIFEGYRPNPDY